MRLVDGMCEAQACLHFWELPRSARLFTWSTQKHARRGGKGPQSTWESVLWKHELSLP